MRKGTLTTQERQPTAASAPPWSAVTDHADDVGVYVHFPYCLQKCPYCDFNSHVPKRHAQGAYAAYTAAVMAELRARLPLLHATDRPRRLRSIFFGGGTPSMWDPAATAEVIAAVRGHFRHDEPLEITLEANPGAVELGKLEDFKAAGITRVSMGVQALDDALLKTLGRIHSSAEALAALDTIQRVGFDSHSVDLMYAIPGQAPEAWRAALEQVLALGVPHVSAYSLIYEPGTLFHAWRDKGRLTPVLEQAEIDMFEATVGLTAARGLARYEVSNFSRPGHESVHNRLYWRSRPYLGVGAGAHSFLDRGHAARSESLRDPAAYIDAWTGGGLKPHPFSMEEAPSTEARADEHVMLGLRTSAGWDFAQTEAELGVAATAAAGATAARHPAWCFVDGGTLRPTDAGFLMNDALILACVELLGTLSSDRTSGEGLKRSRAVGHHGGLGLQ